MSQRSIEVPVKMYRTSDLLTVAAPMPGLGPEDITVEVTERGGLVLEGRLCGLENCGALKGAKEVVTEEWTVGPYRRELVLPAPVDGERAMVTYGNGVLVAALPIVAEARPARVGLERVAPDRGAHLGAGAHPVTRA